MMNPDWLDRLERRFGQYAISNLAGKLLMIKVLVWVMVLLRGDGLLVQLYQEANSLGLGLAGSWLINVIAPPGSSSMEVMDLFWSALCNVVFLFSFSRILEEHIGTFRFNLLIGVYFFLQGILTHYALLPPDDGAPAFYFLESLRFNFIFICVGILLPEMIIHVFFVIPVRARILAILSVLLSFGLAAGILALGGHWSAALWIASPAVYSLAFLGLPRVLDRAKHKARRLAFDKKAATAADKAGHFHRCSICGITDNDDRDTFFRVGSDGQDYCEKHLR
ncbi:MAG: hypothetical protein RL095_1201 [Verrucomicrobiota bacterium]|jgi:hypothetical protein